MVESLGRSSSNFTATNQLFQNESIEYWRFEVVYSFTSENSSSALNFRINQPPKNGSCVIDLVNGTSSTLFTINCSNWADEDGLKDYSVYGLFDSIIPSCHRFVLIESGFFLYFSLDRE